ncbi:hypothetical protein RHSIM_Rhsim02G0146300 [Rhododendron simsii]|uniref:Uncharacterized protein n=1 Tax=Rhododendron simsii TaxID=118357 RepID=A0A834LVG8_RHOSS|nr:hypothetical protein RHSIM_Rhsim02G0146300 [Rhododendron simsii]
MRFYIPMIESEDILEKDNGGIKEIIEREVERDEAAAECEDGGVEAAACEDGDEDETCTGEATRMSELRVSGECFMVVVERDEVAAECEDGGEEAAAFSCFGLLVADLFSLSYVLIWNVGELSLPAPSVPPNSGNKSGSFDWRSFDERVLLEPMPEESRSSVNRPSNTGAAETGLSVRYIEGHLSPVV